MPPRCARAARRQTQTPAEACRTGGDDAWLEGRGAWGVCERCAEPSHVHALVCSPAPPPPPDHSDARHVHGHQHHRLLRVGGRACAGGRVRRRRGDPHIHPSALLTQRELASRVQRRQLKQLGTQQQELLSRSCSAGAAAACACQGVRQAPAVPRSAARRHSLGSLFPMKMHTAQRGSLAPLAHHFLRGCMAAGVGGVGCSGGNGRLAPAAIWCPGTLSRRPQPRTCRPAHSRRRAGAGCWR